MGCGSPPLGLRPNLFLLACFLSLLSFGFPGATDLGESSGGRMPPGDVRPAAIPPPGYWRPEGLYESQHTPGHTVWHPGPSQPQVVVPFVGPWWFAPDGPPSGAPPYPDYDPEEEEQPTLNGDHGSARHGGFYEIDDRYGVGIAAPLHRTDNHGIADIFTRPLPPQALFYDNPSFHGIEPNSEGSDTDSGYVWLWYGRGGLTAVFWMCASLVVTGTR
ncbi:hypothetical protein CYMTET_44455 [Cymbomonas tetramitiformis]|uniref:Uncharacterized protein n=1 Tax=Cymbomonas tetramitiformis TaxID=36881 RepID=A0AAE0F0N5_9CHLO|nr:hypothetical protein CYMTET_44455 [Cymbomonas tetramitiformis]